ncbi:MAG: class I SAM-dependent methyltransferase [Pseudomonadales bacterium]|nr:class I SAM-dependent methyltransferase [Pseudomonadales bacterium]
MSSADTSYEDIASLFMQSERREVGVAEVKAWADHFNEGDSVLDIGCGHGLPLGLLLQERGLQVYAIDASPTLLQQYGKNLPDAEVACESVVDSDFFHRKFDGVLAWGLMFLLSEEDQVMTLNRVLARIVPGGRFLFTSPTQRCQWDDLLTGRESIAIGGERYREILAENGMSVLREYSDAGENHYYDAVKQDAL